MFSAAGGRQADAADPGRAGLRRARSGRRHPAQRGAAVRRRAAWATLALEDRRDHTLSVVPLLRKQGDGRRGQQWCLVAKNVRQSSAALMRWPVAGRREGCKTIDISSYQVSL